MAREVPLAAVRRREGVLRTACEPRIAPPSVSPPRQTGTLVLCGGVDPPGLPGCWSLGSPLAGLHVEAEALVDGLGLPSNARSEGQLCSTLRGGGGGGGVVVK